MNDSRQAGDPTTTEGRPKEGRYLAIVAELSRREFFAGMALQGLLSRYALPWTGDDSYRNAVANAAQKAVDVADALLAALESPDDGPPVDLGGLADGR